MPRQTQPTLASIVQAYTDEASELLAELSEAIEHDDRSDNVTMRLCNWLGRLQLAVENVSLANKRGLHVVP